MEIKLEENQNFCMDIGDKYNQDTAYSKSSKHG